MSRLRSFTVKELIEILEDYDPKALVVYTVDYGDYHNTQQALPIQKVSDQQEMGVIIVKSAYSQSEFALVEYDEDDIDPREEQTRVPVVILSMSTEGVWR